MTMTRCVVQLLFNVASELGRVEQLAKQLVGADGVSIASIPYASTSRVLAGNSRLSKLLLGGEYLLIDSFPYKLACDANFAQYPDPFNTKVFVGSSQRELRALADAPAASDRETLEAIDSASFVNVNAVEAGVNVKLYVYASSVDTLLAHVRHGVLQSLPDIQKVRESRDTLALTKWPDRVHYTIVFPLALNARDVRKRLFDAGYSQSVTGTDIQRQYVFLDENTTEMWKEGFEHLPFFGIKS